MIDNLHIPVGKTAKAVDISILQGEFEQIYQFELRQTNEDVSKFSDLLSVHLILVVQL